MQKRSPRQQHASISRSLVFVLFLFPLIFAKGTTAQDATSNQLWPEIDVYVNLKPKFRLFFIATASRAVEDGGAFSAQAFEAQVGAHIDYIPNKHVILRAGYRFGTSVRDSDDPFKENRVITEQTLRKLLPGSVLVSDRNREDFRFIDGDFSFRYRNRVTVEREIHVFRNRSITPYVSGEVFYDTRYDTWNRNRWVVGVQTSLRRGALLKMLLPKRQIVLDLSYQRQNDSRSSTAHVNAIAASLSFYF